MKGFEQRPGTEFGKIYAHIINYTTLRLLLVTVAQRQLNLLQSAARSVFLNGDLQEELYVAYPKGFEEVGNERKILPLHKKLSGLREAARAWYYCVFGMLSGMGFERTQAMSRYRTVLNVLKVKLVSSHTSKICCWRLTTKKNFNGSQRKCRRTSSWALRIR